MNPSQIADLYRFSEWANAQFFEEFSRLDAEEWTRSIGGSFGSLQGTAAHVVGVEWLWFERCQKRAPPGLPDWSVAPTVEQLMDIVSTLEIERRAWVASLTDADLDRAIEYRLLDGTDGSSPLSLLLRHVVDHSSYHRGQFATLLRLLGRVPPSTGLVRWDLLDGS